MTEYNKAQSEFEQQHAAEEARYRRQVARAYGHLTLRGYPERDPRLGAVPLERIFVKLSTTTRRSSTMELPLSGQVRELERLLERYRMNKAQGLDERGLVFEGKMLTEEEADELLQRYEHEVEERRKPQTITLSVPEALRDHNRLVITGPPGSGKTTLLRWLALTFAEGKQSMSDRLGETYPRERLPVVVELRKFHNRFAGDRERLTTVNLADEIAAFVAEDARFEGTTSDFIRLVLASGECLVAFDGLDEVADFTARQRASGALQAFADNYSALGNCIIVTSRPAGYKGVELGPGFHHCEINPFTTKDVSLFIHHWCDAAYLSDPATAREDASELVKAIDGNERVANLAKTPLLCTIIAIVYRNNRILPKRRVELYLKCCEALLDTWERVKEIRQSGLIGEFDWQTKLELLSPLAYWLHSEVGRTAAPEREFEIRLAAELRKRRLCEEPKAEQEARVFLAAIRERSGLLQGRGDGTLEFPHLTFQEYLAARHIAAQVYPKYIDLLMPRLHDAWWQEVHLLTVGHLGSGRDGAHKAGELLEAILDRHKPPMCFLRAIPYPGSRLTRSDSASIAILGGVGEWLRTLPARRFPRWQLLRRLSWAIQRERLFAAAAMGDCAPLGVTNKARDRIRAAIEDVLLLAVADARRMEQQCSPWLTAAASCLGQLGQASPEAVAALIGALADSQGSVRQAAASSLGVLGQASPEVVTALVDALGDNEGNVRRVATASLGQLGQASPRVVLALVGTLGDSEWRVRQEAAGSLVQLGQASSDAVTALVGALGNSDWRVRQEAASSLVRLGQSSPEVMAALAGALGDTDWRVRREAAASLVRLGQSSPEVVAALVTATGDRVWSVRQAAINSLVQLGQSTPEVMAALVGAMGDSVWPVRQAAASSLGRLGQCSPEVTAILIEALRDNEGPVRQTAANSLGQLGQAPAEARAALVDTLRDESWPVRHAAASSLVRLGQAPREAVATLVDALEHDAHYVRQAAASSLGQLGQASPEAVTILLRTLEDSVWPVRQAAASSLVQLGQELPRAVEALVSALWHRPWPVRQEAASSLGQLGQATPEVVAALVDALRDSEWRVRQEAARSLGHLGWSSPEAIVELNRNLHHSNANVRIGAYEALSKLLNGKRLPGEGWAALGERQERSKHRKRWARQVLLILIMAIPPLAYVLGVLFVPWVQENWELLLAILLALESWLAFLANLGKIRQTLGDLWR